MSNELAYYDALKRIAKNYQTPDQLRRNSERDFGCSYHEALEMAYENLQWEASRAIHGKRRPKITSAMTRPTVLCSCKASERDGQHMAWCPSLTRPQHSGETK